MKSNFLRKLLVFVVSFVVAFGAVLQTAPVAFAAEQPAGAGAELVQEPPADLPELAPGEAPAPSPEEVPAPEDPQPDAPSSEDPPPPEEPEPADPPQKYWVAFDAYGGSFGAEKVIKTKQTSGAVYELPQKDPVREGYTFKGWYTDKTGGVQITSSTTVEITESTRLFARWAGKKYWVKFDANGGMVGSEAVVSTKQTNGEKYVLPKNPVREGFTFKGWYTAKSGGTKITSTSNVNITKSTRLFARWAGKNYWVMFDANGGLIGNDPSFKTKQANGSKFMLPPDPVRGGYAFAGWYTEPLRGNRVDASTVVNISKSTRLFAHWDMQTDADLVVETKINLNGSGTGWHGKLVIQDGNAAISFGIQHDTHSGIGPQNQDYLMTESVRNSPGYHSYKGHGAIGPGWHTLRLEYYQATNKARGYCDGVLVADVAVMPMDAAHISVNKEAVPRKTGDTVDAQFKDMFIYTDKFWYNGFAEFQQYGSFAVQRSEIKSNNPHGNYLYNEQGEIWRLFGTANIPNGGDWDSYDTVGVRVMYIFVRN